MPVLNYEFDTLKVRGGYNPKENNNAVSVPYMLLRLLNLEVQKGQKNL